MNNLKSLCQSMGYMDSVGECCPSQREQNMNARCKHMLVQGGYRTRTHDVTIHCQGSSPIAPANHASPRPRGDVKQARPPFFVK